MRRLIVLALAALLLTVTGCGSYWEDQGTAAVRNAGARQAQAQAAIIEAQAQGALAESQAQALAQSIDAVTDLADDGEYIAVFAAIAFAVLGFSGWAIWATHRRPAMPAPQSRKMAVIEAGGQRLQLEQGSDETPAAFVWRVQQIAAQMEASEQRQLARWEPQ